MNAAAAHKQNAIDMLAINTIRGLAIDAIQAANSGHPGLPLGAAPMAHVLWQQHLRHNPRNPTWANRDRFVLSGGHGSMLLYALLHLHGYDVTLDDLKAFRQWGSRTPGHPEAFHTAGVEATTGPLGQGSANAVGMAIAERALAHLFNRPEHTIVDYRTYALVTDGDLMEGVNAEAASLAGHLGLGKLTYLYDANDISLDGPTSLTYTEDFGKRYEAYGWQVLEVKDGNTDLGGIDAALKQAQAQSSRPTLIIVRTTIGYGSPNKQGSSAAHGAPLGADEVRRTKKMLGLDADQSFAVPAAVHAHTRAAAITRGEQAQRNWQQRLDAYAKAHPDLHAQWQHMRAGELPAGWDSSLPTWEAGQKIATRSASGKIINAIAARLPWFIGGDADLSCSTKTAIGDGGSFDGASGAGRNIHYGVREHAMAAIANGMAYDRAGLRNFVSTFFVFSDYMRPSVRVAALSGLPVTYVWTHDSIGVGEDGPTHQPVEHLMALRAMPNLAVVRPADAVETAAAWRLALQHRAGPVALVLTRQDVPVLPGSISGAATGVPRGAYVISEAPGGAAATQAIVIATGSEVALAVEAQRQLAAAGIAVRVVSMPCWELFAAQARDYREAVLPPTVRNRVAVEAGVSMGWERWVGERGSSIGIDRYGASAPAERIAEELGLTAAAIITAVRAGM